MRFTVADDGDVILKPIRASSSRNREDLTLRFELELLEKIIQLGRPFVVQVVGAEARASRYTCDASAANYIHADALSSHGLLLVDRLRPGRWWMPAPGTPTGMDPHCTAEHTNRCAYGRKSPVTGA